MRTDKKKLRYYFVEQSNALPLIQSVQTTFAKQKQSRLNRLGVQRPVGGSYKIIL